MALLTAGAAWFDHLGRDRDSNGGETSVIEIDATSESLDKTPIYGYATFRVPEVWRYDVKRGRVHLYELRGSTYVEMC